FRPFSGTEGRKFSHLRGLGRDSGGTLTPALSPPPARGQARERGPCADDRGGGTLGPRGEGRIETTRHLLKTETQVEEIRRACELSDQRIRAGFFLFRLAL